MSFPKGNCSGAGLVSKYIGSAYDTVKEVADAIEDVTTVADNITDVNTVATNIDDIKDIADNITEYRVTESFVLVQGQMVINTSKVVVSACTVSINSQLVDAQELFRDRDYRITGTNQITLLRSYPVGSEIKISQYVYKDDIGDLDIDAVTFDDATGVLTITSKGIEFKATISTQGVDVDTLYTVAPKPWVQGETNKAYQRRIFSKVGQPDVEVYSTVAAVMGDEPDLTKFNVYTSSAKAINIKAFGIVGDGVADDTAAMTLFGAIGGNVYVDEHTTISTDPFEISANKTKLDILGKIVLKSATSTVGVSVTGDFCEISGEITCDSGLIFSNFLVSSEGYATKFKGATIYYPEKPTYVGDGVNIPYHTGVLGLRSHYAEVSECSIYNGRGAGIWNYRENVTIEGNRIHNNITGIVLQDGGSSGFGDNCVVKSNHIYDNDVCPHYSGASGILSYNTTKGHVVSGNTISGSGEHGTYWQARRSSITGNVVFGNNQSGIKSGGKSNTITGNTAYDNNTGDSDDDAGIYAQSPLGNTVISSNIVRSVNNQERFGIRVVYIPSKAVAGEEDDVIVSSNVVSGAFEVSDIRVSGTDRFNVIGNVCSGEIEISQSTTDHPLMELCRASDNICKKLTVDKVKECMVSSNVIDELEILTSALVSEIKGNKINAQTAQLRLQHIATFDDNIVKYQGLSPLFEQGVSISSNSNKSISRNEFYFDNEVAVVQFTTQGVSGNDITMISNICDGTGRLFDGWGDNHVLSLNVSRDSTLNRIWHRGGNTSLITNNLMNVTGSGTGDVVANNLVRT